MSEMQPESEGYAGIQIQTHDEVSSGYFIIKNVPSYYERGFLFSVWLHLWELC